MISLIVNMMTWIATGLVTWASELTLLQVGDHLVFIVMMAYILLHLIRAGRCLVYGRFSEAKEDGFRGMVMMTAVVIVGICGLFI